MSLRIIEVSAPEGAADKIKKLAENNKAIDLRYFKSHDSLFSGKEKDERSTTRILVNVKNQQDLLDALSRAVNKHEGWRVNILPVEATLPQPEDDDEKEKKEKQEEADRKAEQNAEGKPSIFYRAWHHVLTWWNWAKGRGILAGSISREELQQDIEQGGKISADFILMTILSTIVAGVGLVQSDVAIIIGAMVIAPLLGPNLALSFGAALGNKDMFLQAAWTNVVGLGLTLFISAVAGLFIPEANITESKELMTRTEVTYASIGLALSAGGAAVLSLTSGVSSALVGVMVAVALMPPAVALGLTIGNAQWTLAFGTALLLSINIVCINLAALAVFRLKGIRPRTWYEEQNAKKAARNNAIFWGAVLLLLVALIWVKNTYLGD